MMSGLLLCPNCKRNFDVNYGLNSGLGRPRIICPKCGEYIATGRAEWADFTGFQRLRYYVVSGIYAVASGVLGYFAGAVAYHFLTVWPYFDDLQIPNPGGPVGAVLFVAVAIALQVYRVKESLAHSANPEGVSEEMGARDLDRNNQARMTGLFFGVAVLAWGLGFLTYKGPPPPPKAQAAPTASESKERSNNTAKQGSPAKERRAPVHAPPTPPPPPRPPRTDRPRFPAGPSPARGPSL